MADSDHIVERIAEKIALELMAAMPDLKGYSIDRSPEEPLMEYELDHLSIYTGKEVTGNPNGIAARTSSGIITRMVRFYAVITVRSSSLAKKKLFGFGKTADKVLFTPGQTLGGLVEEVEHVETETVNVLEGSLETAQRFIGLNTRGLGLRGEPSFGTAEVYSASNQY